MRNLPSSSDPMRSAIIDAILKGTPFEFVPSEPRDSCLHNLAVTWAEFRSTDKFNRPPADERQVQLTLI